MVQRAHPARHGQWATVRRLARLLIAIFALTIGASGAAAHPVDDAVARARRERLWTSQQWWRLLHYREDLFGNVSSEVDGRRFFLAEQGKTDPQAELLATLRAFYAPARRHDAHARCRFPARFRWLDEVLGLRETAPRVECRKLSAYRRRHDWVRVSVVYASSSLENPVSAFGHTFLRMHTRRADVVDADADADRIDVAVEYKARTDTNNPFWYAFKGLTGMFRGQMTFDVLRDKMREYTHHELREVWEYDLALTAREIEMLRSHLWELSVTHFDYFYMTENCSYHVLSVLEAAAPRLPLRANVKHIVLPIDTIRAIYATPGLVRSVRYRPARSYSQRTAVAARGGAMSSDVPARGAAAGTPWHKAPHTGHGSLRVSLGSGATTQRSEPFYTLGLRLALHDFADPPRGNPELSQVQFLDTRARYHLERRNVTLEEITFAELFALNPVGRDGPLLSWRARAVGQRLRDEGCASENCFAHGLNGALGFTLASDDSRVAAFGLADVHVLFSGDVDGVFDSFVRAGIGPLAGVRLHLTPGVVALATFTWAYLPAQDLESSYDGRALLRAGLSRHVALGAELRLQPAAAEGQFLSYLYF